MHFGITRKAVEEARHLECGGVRFLVERQIAAFQRISSSFSQLARPGKMRQPFSEAADLVFGDTEDFGHFGKGAAGLKRGEPSDNGCVSGTVLFKNQID